MRWATRFICATVMAASLSSCGPPPFERNASSALLEYKHELYGSVGEALKQQLDQIDMSETGSVDPRPLAFVAADRATRVLLPMAFEVVGANDSADRYRALEPLLDAASVKAALSDPALGLRAAATRAVDKAPSAALPQKGLVGDEVEMVMRGAAMALVFSDLADSSADPAARAQKAGRSLWFAAMAAASAMRAAQLVEVDRMTAGLGMATVGGVPVPPKEGPSGEQIAEAGRSLMADLVAVAKGKKPQDVAPPAKAKPKPAAATSDAAPGEPCEKPSGEFSVCLMELARSGKGADLAATCRKAILDDPLKTPIGKMDACRHLGPAVLFDLDKVDESKDFAAKVCDFPILGQKGPPDAKQRMTMVAAMACDAAVTFHVDMPKETPKTLADRLSRAVPHFAKACFQDPKAARKRASEICGQFVGDAAPKK
jgi:hypothetical protein